MKLESKIGTIKKSQTTAYHFLSKLDNFNKIIPSDKINNWKATEDCCSFSVDMAGDIDIEIINREPEKTLKFKGKAKTQPFEFFFWIQLKEVAINDTRIKLTIDAELPVMIAPMVKKPLQNALNTIIDRLPELLKYVN